MWEEGCEKGVMCGRRDVSSVGGVMWGEVM